MTAKLRVVAEAVQRRLSRPKYLRLVQNPDGQIEAEQVEFLTVEELAEFLHVTPRTVYHWKEAGMVPCYKVPDSKKVLFELSEILAWLKRQNWQGGQGQG